MLDHGNNPRSDGGDWSYVETKLVAGLTFIPVLSLLCKNENPDKGRGVTAVPFLITRAAVLWRSTCIWS